MDNPLGLLPPDLTRLATDTARLIQTGKDIGSTVAQVNQNFADMFGNLEAANYADKFRKWAENSLNGLHQATQNAGMHREQFASDAAALQELVKRVASSDGNLAALKTLGDINTHQIQESMKLRDLIATQQQAINTHIAAQAKREQEIADMNQRLWNPEDRPVPKPRPKKPGQF